MIASKIAVIIILVWLFPYHIIFSYAFCNVAYCSFIDLKHPVDYVAMNSTVCSSDILSLHNK